MRCLQNVPTYVTIVIATLLAVKLRARFFVHAKLASQEMVNAVLVSECRMTKA